jgi:hypothetical protein
MRKSTWLANFMLMAAATAPARAAIAPDTTIVPVFEKACLQPGTEEAIRAAVAADSGWARSEPDPSLAIGSRKDPKSYDAYSRTVEGRRLQLVLVKFTKRPKEFMCVLLVPDVENMLPYLDDFRRATKAVGLNGFQTDLPHLYRTKGRLPSGHRAQSDIFSRTPFLPGQQAMHMFLAY